jgi:pyruvate/2-oxoglutarate dehydrogenase complex dihydrolipoamide acyltransferase (E2) component
MWKTYFKKNSALGIGKIQKCILEKDGILLERFFVNFSLSCDHRVIDGADAARWLNTFHDYITNPIKILVE